LGDPRIKVMPWLARAAALEGATLAVNTTTQGMRSQPALDLDLMPLPVGAAVLDCVYAPLETPLLKTARARGLIAIDGLGMLIHQARPGFAAWFGREPEITPELRAFLAEGL
jgi:shikimate dehydrogenase